MLTVIVNVPADAVWGVDPEATTFPQPGCHGHDELPPVSSELAVSQLPDQLAAELPLQPARPRSRPGGREQLLHVLLISAQCVSY